MANKRINLILWSWMLCAVAARPVVAQHSQKGGVRPIGMGSAFVAVGDDENTLFFNPAGLNTLKRGHTTVLVNFQGIQNKQSFDVFKFLLDEHDVVSNLLDHQPVENQTALNKLQQVAEVPANLAISNRLFETVGYNKGVSFQVENFSQYKLEQTTTGWRIRHFFSMRSTLLVGYARKMPSENNLAPFAFGASFAYVVSENYSEFNQIQNSQDFRSYYYQPNLRRIFDKTIMQNGLIANLGGLYKIQKYHTNVGAVIYNFLTMGGLDPMAKVYSFGIANRPLEFTNTEFLKDCVIAVDYVDAFTSRATLHLGLEAKLPLIAGRVGLQGGRTTYGLSLDLGFLKIHYAYAPVRGTFYLFEKNSYQHFVEFRIGS